MRNRRLGVRRIRSALVALAVTPVACWCQIPIINSVVDAASYEPTQGSPGYIVTIFGTNLASSTASAESVPLPYELAGTSVTEGGVAAPLFYVSPTQINLQVPEFPQTPDATVLFVVSTAAGSSAPYNPYTPDTWPAGGIFTTNSSGCGQGAVLNVAANGSLSANSTANSASPGDWISIFGTGLIEGNDLPIDVPAPLPSAGSSYDSSYEEGLLLFDLTDLDNGPISSFWEGLAPGLVGVDQINVQIPSSVREGCAVPLQIEGYTFQGQGVTPPVTIAVRQGGGPCVDPPSAGYGQITWQKTVSTVQPDVVSESDTVTVSLQTSPGMQAPAAPVFTDICPPPSYICNGPQTATTTYFGPSCPVPGYRNLDAGTVTVQGPSLSPAVLPVVPYIEGQLSTTAYQATLPSGTIQAGNYAVAANGGADVGAFQAALQVGTDIQIETALNGLVVFGQCQPLTINWTGGDPNSWLTMKLIQQPGPGFDFVIWSAQTRTANGTLTFPVPTVAGFDCMGGPQPITISIEVDPDPSEVTTFSAPGLSLGGQATWKYVHTFQASLAI
jgi:uncharacterized protein (TIGR03437 family)